MSVLADIKKTLGIEENDMSFDDEITLFVNGAISTLKQVAILPGALVQNSDTQWSEVIGVNSNLDLAKTYISVSVRLVFDPPRNSFTVSSLEKMLEELTWRIRTASETNVPSLYLPEGGNDDL